MRRRLLLATFVLLVLVLATPTAFAQSGGGDKVIFNEAFTLAEGEVLRGNLAVVGGTITLAPGSTVDGDVAVFGSTLTINGTIAGSVAAFGGRVILGASALVMGDFAALGGSVEQAPGAVIRGETLSGLRSFGLNGRDVPAPTLEVFPPLGRARGAIESFMTWQLRTLGTALLLALLGVAALLVAPKGVERVANAAAIQPAVSFGVGLLTLLLGLFAGTLLLIACGLGLLIWLGLLLALLLGWIGLGLWVGQRLLTTLRVRTASSVAEVILGVFLLTLLGSLPLCIGFLVWLILGSIGLGAVVLTRFGTQTADGGVEALPASSADRAQTPEASAPADAELSTDVTVIDDLTS